jgi:hypothetical protein
MKPRCFEGPIFGPSDRIFRLDHVRHNRPGGLYEGGRSV